MPEDKTKTISFLTDIDQNKKLREKNENEQHNTGSEAQKTVGMAEEKRFELRQEINRGQNDRNLYDEGTLKAHLAEEEAEQQAALRIVKLATELNGQPATPENVRKAQQLLQSGSGTESFLDGTVVYVETEAKGTKEDGKGILKIDARGVRDELNNKLLNSDNSDSVAEYVNAEVEGELKLQAAERLIRYWQAHAEDKNALGNPDKNEDLERLVNEAWFPRFFTTVSLFASAMQRHKTNPDISPGEQRLGSVTFAVALETAVKRSVEAIRIITELQRENEDEIELPADLNTWTELEGLLTDKESPLLLKENGYPLHSEFWITPDGKVLRSKLYDYILMKALQEQEPDSEQQNPQQQDFA